jgi:hypothetical protein
MKRALRSVPFFLILLGFLLFPNCATLTRSRTQKVPVTSNPVGATVTVNGFQRGVTPLALKLTRKDKSYDVRIEYPGYNPLEIRTKRGFSTPVALADGVVGGFSAFAITAIINFANGHDELPGVNVGVLLLGIGAFFLLDVTSGTGYEVRPSELHVTLSKTKGSPRVDTVFIDAADLRSIKWIRIHGD